MYIGSGLDKWANPVAYNRYAGLPDDVTDGAFLGQYIAKTYPNRKLGILEQSGEASQDYDKGLRNGIEGSSVEIVDVEQYDVIVSDVSAQTERLKAAGADVVAFIGIPPQAASLVTTARQTLSWNVPIILDATNTGDIFIALATPQNAEGIMSSTFGYQVENTDVPGVQKYEKIWDKFQNGTQGPMNNFEVYGMFIAENTVWDLEMAGKDLTRETFLDAAQSMCNYWCSSCFAPLSTSPTDHRVCETLVIDKVENGKWVSVGDPVSYESTKSCTPKAPPADFDKQPKVGADAPYVETP